MKIFYSLFLVIFIISCNSKTKSTNSQVDSAFSCEQEIIIDKLLNESYMYKKIIVDILPIPEKNNIIRNLNQIRDFIEIDQEFDLFTTDEETISIELPIDSYLFEKNGLKILSESEFKDKIQEKFNFSFDNKPSNLIEHPNFHTFMLPHDGHTYPIEFVTGAEWDPSYHHFYISTKYRIIGVGRYFSGFDMNEDSQFTVYFPTDLYHINNFILSDSKASLTWLLNNDMEFLSLFVWKVGYDKNEKINEAVLNYIFRDYEMFDGYPVEYDKFDELFFTKGFDGKLSIRKELLRSIEKITTQDNLKYIYFLKEYIFDFFTNSNKKEKYSTKELSEIFVNMAAVEERMRTAYFKPAAPEWSNRSNSYYLSIQYPELLETAEKYNYFDIPFEDVLEMFQWDGEPL